MTHTKLGPNLHVSENDKHESHSFWFDNFHCSLKVDRRKDGQSLAITMKTPEGKVVISLGPQDQPRLVAEVKHSKQWNDHCEYSSQISKKAVRFRFDYEPKAGA